MAKRSKPRPSQALPPAPPLGEILKGRFNGAISGPYHRWTDGQHIGPYSPRYVPISALKFMREDPQLSLGLAAYRGPFFGIDYDLTGGTPETRAFIRKVFMDTPLLDRSIFTILNALDYGFQAHEMIWKRKDVKFDPDGPSGPATPVEMLGAVVMAEANDIDPSRVVMVTDEADRLLGYRVDGDFVDLIPVSKALHAVNQMEHRNWRGRGILKRAYKPWWWHEFISLFMSRWYERKSDPPYHVTAPPTPRKDPKTGKEVYPPEVMRQLALDLRSSGVIATPFEVEQLTKQMMWTIKELTDGGRAGEFVTGLSYLDAQKLRAIGVPEEIATRGSVGSQAKTDTVLGVFLQELEVTKKTLVLPTINAGIIDPLINFNFGSSVEAPRVTAPEFNREQKALLGELLKLILQIPQELGDNEEFRPVDIINAERLVALLNVPHRRAKEVAQPKGTFPQPGIPAPQVSPGGGEAPAADARFYSLGW